MSGYNVFFDKRSIDVGRDWMYVLQQALDNSDIMILFVSEKSMISKYVRTEYEQFIEMGKPIIPVILDDVRLPENLSKIQYLRFNTITNTLEKRRISLDYAPFGYTMLSSRERTESPNLFRHFITLEDNYEQLAETLKRIKKK
jgi:hypothetical protein